MRTVVKFVAGLGVFLAVGGLGSPVQADSRATNGGGWVQVSSGSAVPQNLSVGDQIQLSVGSGNGGGGTVVGFADCGGQRTYYTSTRQSGCGWRNAIIAYARTTPATGLEAASVSPAGAPP